MNNREIEIKLKIDDLNYILPIIESIGNFRCKFKQIDQYYQPPEKNFIDGSNDVCEWLRLRKVEPIEAKSIPIKYEFCYKDWLPHGEDVKTHCLEFEINVSSYEQTEKILERLKFRKLVRVNKIRSVWAVVEKEIEISVDEVENLGTYIELEYKGESTDVDLKRKLLIDLTKDIKMNGELIKKGYPHLLLDIENKSYRASPVGDDIKM